VEIANIYNQKENVDCLSCDLISGKIPLPFGSILQDEHFDAHQDFEIPIPGFVIVVSKRHIESIDEFTEEEKTDFINFMIKVRKAIRTVLNIEYVYLIQEEDTRHHFHFWLFPVTDDFLQKFGRGVKNVRPYMEYARANLKTDQNLKVIQESADKMREYLTQK